MCMCVFFCCQHLRFSFCFSVCFSSTLPRVFCVPSRYFMCNSCNCVQFFSPVSRSIVFFSLWVFVHGDMFLCFFYFFQVSKKYDCVACRIYICFSYLRSFCLRVCLCVFVTFFLFFLLVSSCLFQFFFLSPLCDFCFSLFLSPSPRCVSLLYTLSVLHYIFLCVFMCYVCNCVFVIVCFYVCVFLSLAILPFSHFRV